MKKVISLIFVIMFAVIGCSKITPAPEIVITDVNPPGGLAVDSTGTASITVTFENKNDVDAIITNETIVFQDTVGGSATESYPISQYVNANSVVELTTTFASVPALGGVTSGRTMQLTFTGTDAYGYDKTFTVSTTKICY